MRPTCLTLALVLLLAGSQAVSAAAGNPKNGAFKVSVEVISSIRLLRVEQPETVTLTDEDVRRGYADVSAPSRLLIGSNSRSGYLLVVSFVSDWIRLALIRGLQVESQVSTPGGRLLQPHSGKLRHELELRYQLHLHPGTRPGTYPWPIELSVQPP